MYDSSSLVIDLVPKMAFQVRWFPPHLGSAPLILLQDGILPTHNARQSVCILTGTDHMGLYWITWTWQPMGTDCLL